MKHAKQITAAALAFFVVLSLFAFSASAAPSAPVFSSGWSEDFDDISTLSTDGWSMINQSTVVGSTTWFQGNNTVFPSYEGVDSSYIGANFNSTTGNNTISTWLITPETTLSNGSTLTFYTRGATGGFADRLQVRLSSNGSSSDVGIGAEGTGDFSTLLLDINPELTATGYPSSAWTAYTATISGLTEPVSGRLAFRYYVTNGGISGANSNYIGIDSVRYTQRLEVLASSSLPAGGTVSGAGTYNYNAPVTLTAAPNTDYRFDNWTNEEGTIVSSDLIYNFAVVNPISLTANFSLRTGAVTMSLSPEAAATDGAAWSIDGGTTWFDSGEEDIVQGTYDITFRDITGWTTPDSLSDITVIENSSLDLSASYIRKTYTVTLPADTGYTIVPELGNSSPVTHGEDYSFRITLDDAYSNSTVIAAANGLTLTPVDGVYTLTNVQENQSITVSGVIKNSYTVSFHWFAGDSGAALDIQNILHGDFAIAPAVPLRSDLEFAGWDTSFSNVISNLDVTALWSLQGVTITPYSNTYDGTVHPVITISGTLSGDTITYDTGSGYSSVVPTAMNAGIYPVTVKIERTGAEVWTSGISEASILPAPASVTINADLSKVYDGSPAADPDVTLTGDGILNILWFIDNNGSVGSSLASAPIDPGTYWVQVQSPATVNYTSASVLQKFTISSSSGGGTTETTPAPTVVPTAAPTVEPIPTETTAAATTPATTAATAAAANATSTTTAKATAATTAGTTADTRETTVAVTTDSATETAAVASGTSEALETTETSVSSQQNVAGASISGIADDATEGAPMWLILLAVFGGIAVLITLSLFIVSKTKKSASNRK